MTYAVQRRGLALALLAATQFVLVLDASIVGVALPSIGTDLTVAPENLSWVANAYTLTFGGLLLLGGRAADLLGRRRTFITGMALFALASLAGSLSTNAAVLIGARAVQGVGAAIVAPAALSLVMTIFTPDSGRNMAMGVFGAVAGAGGAVGSILGGVLTEWLGWEATLYVNVPIGALVIALAPRLLPEASDSTARGIDVAGAVSATSGLALLVYALVDANNAGWASVQTLVLGALALGMFALFVFAEARSAHPLVPLRIFRSPSLRGANVAALLTTMAMFPLFFYLTFYMQQVLHYGPIGAGLAQLPLALSIAVTAGTASSVIARFGVRTPMVAGLLITAAGLGWFSRMSADGGFLTDVLGPTLVIGVGSGLAFVTTTVGATSGISAEQAGLASGLFTTSQQVGGSLGLAVVVAVATAGTAVALDGGERVMAMALTHGYQAGMLTAAAIALLAGLIAAVVMPSRAAARIDRADPEPATSPVTI
ncbi:MAG: DHA2 family efflux MFS transporter permease subunit [Hamadaea sp.]|uniref:DHA2 family efflux MFS transporter permease subunit n=1 Tax=Hamadaea sp. TaxID=2024425 RepID=UPI0018294785|nr:DHA2 family efflux MFS transporter permease subunit [Hamadaea sp.]NUT21844.1 DHA2 family efflux MFS transporter permease subunit [Hamadaea sp.]